MPSCDRTWTLVYRDGYHTQFLSISHKFHVLDCLSCPPLCARAKIFFNQLFRILSVWNSLSSVFECLTLFQQNANFSASITLNKGQSNETRHSAVGMVQRGLSFLEDDRRMSCSHQTIMKLVERNTMAGSWVIEIGLDAGKLRHVDTTAAYSSRIFGIRSELPYKRLKSLWINNQRISHYENRPIPIYV